MTDDLTSAEGGELRCRCGGSRDDDWRPQSGGRAWVGQPAMSERRRERRLAH